MGGTKIGGKKSVTIIKRKHGADFFKKIGAMGGANSNTGGFAGNPERARIEGAKGGVLSKRRAEVADAVFIDAWHRFKSVSEVAEYIGILPDSVSTRAARLRHRGYELPYKKRLKRRRNG